MVNESFYLEIRNLIASKTEGNIGILKESGILKIMVKMPICYMILYVWQII